MKKLALWTLIVVAGLFVTCTGVAVIGVLIFPKEDLPANPAPITSSVNTPTPTAPPTANPTVASTEWHRFTLEQVQWVNGKMDKYILEELEVDLAYSTDAEIRGSLCGA